VMNHIDSNSLFVQKPWHLRSTLRWQISSQSRMFAPTIAFLQNSTGGDGDPVNSAHSCKLPHDRITCDVWCNRHARKCTCCSKVTGSFVLSRSIVIVSLRSGAAPSWLKRWALNKQKRPEP